MFCNSSIIASSTWRRPAVSRITTLNPWLFACSTAALAILTGFCLSPMEKTSTPCFSPFIWSCVIAAGRYTSHATRSGFLPFDLNLPASFAVVVVFPAPWRPAIMITVTSLAGRSAISVVSDPIRFTSSSFTILITIWPGFSPFITSWPIARSWTAFINCFTTLKLTSASRRASFTSFSAVLTSASVSLPLPRRFLNIFCSLSDKLSNAIVTSTVSRFYNSFSSSSEIFLTSSGSSAAILMASTFSFRLTNLSTRCSFVS